MNGLGHDWEDRSGQWIARSWSEAQEGLEGLGPSPKCIPDSKVPRTRKLAQGVRLFRTGLWKRWECRRTQPGQGSPWKKPGCQQRKAGEGGPDKGNLGGLGEAIGPGGLALGQEAGCQRYPSPCLLISGYHRSLGLFFRAERYFWKAL